MDPNTLVQPEETTIQTPAAVTSSKSLLQKFMFPLALLVALVVLVGLVLLLRKPTVKKTARVNSAASSAVVSKPASTIVVKIADIKSQADLKKLSTEQGTAFCKDVLTYKVGAPEIVALNARLGYSGKGFEDVFLGCSVNLSQDDYVAKDKSGANDAYYRRDAAKELATAKTFTFDTYDTTYEVKDLDLFKRVTIDIKGEAKSLLMEYSTLTDGGYSPYSGNEAIRIQEFNMKDFPGLTNNCGPDLMDIAYVSQYNQITCTTTAATFQGEPVYKGQGISISAYAVTVGTTRITVEARDEAESLKVITGLKKVPFDKLDYFIKN